MNKRRTGKPTANEFGKIRALLAKSGMKRADIKAAMGSAVRGRNRRAIADELRVWLRTVL